MNAEHPAPSASVDGRKILALAELRIVLVYIFGGTLWIVYSDMALDWLTNDPIDSLQLQTYKGLNFVLTTALLLYIVLRRSFDRWRRAERLLRESEERYKWVGRAATDAIWDWTLSSNSVWWSDSFYNLFGYDREEVAPTPDGWRNRLHPEDKAAIEAEIEAVLKSHRQMWAGEYRFLRKNGTYAFVEDRGYVIRDTDGKPVRVVGGMTDITPRKESEAKLERSHRLLRSLSARLQSLREDERARIAREIHDDLGQTLTALKMDLRWAETRLAREMNLTLNPILDRIVEAGELADATIAGVQRIAAELRPGLLDDLGLAAALRHEARRFQDRTGVRCQLQISESLPELTGTIAMHVFRIFQEALTNVARHAEASDVSVTLAMREDELSMRISDDGKGICQSALGDAKSLGLLGMQERAESLSGEVAILPGSPRGTVVELTLPLSIHKMPGVAAIA